MKRRRRLALLALAGVLAAAGGAAVEGALVRDAYLANATVASSGAGQGQGPFQITTAPNGRVVTPTFPLT